jgi:hypothetical protein
MNITKRLFAIIAYMLVIRDRILGLYAMKNQSWADENGAHPPLTQHENVMPSAIVVETIASYDARVTRNRARPGDYGRTSVFRNVRSNRAYVVGEEAMQAGSPIRITGNAKYSEGILDTLVLAALEKSVPVGHDNIMLSLGRTSDSIPFIDDMQRILVKKHQIERYDGKPVNFNVRAFLTWDESEGGLYRWAEQNQNLLQPGLHLVICDIGGKVSSMFPAEILSGGKIQTYWRAGQTLDLGIQDVIYALESELKALYPDQFKIRSIHPDLLEQALRYKQMMLRGESFDVTRAVTNATAIIIAQLHGVFTNRLQGALNAHYVVVTGGGGGLLFELLKEKVFERDSVIPAEMPEMMHFANMRGGAMATLAWCGENMGKLILRRKGGQNIRPALVTIDPGNSLVKWKAEYL